MKGGEQNGTKGRMRRKKAVRKRSQASGEKSSQGEGNKSNQEIERHHFIVYSEGVALITESDSSVLLLS